MKKYFIGLLALALACSSCGTSQMASGDPGAIFAGAAIGGNVGGAIGGVLGMFLGVPIVAVIAYLLTDLTDFLLKKKNIEPDLSNIKYQEDLKFPEEYSNKSRSQK